MTNEEQKLREFIHRCGSYAARMDMEHSLSDLTALISEGYVSKEEHEKMKHDLTHCGSCGDPLSRDCQRCKHLWET